MLARLAALPSGAAGERACVPAAPTGDDADRLNQTRMRWWRRSPAIVNASLTTDEARQAQPNPHEVLTSLNRS